MAHAKSADPNIFILPDLGEGLEEAELISWKVKEGQTVAEHDILAEMETDKALVEVPSPRAGVIKETFGSEGEILKVGVKRSLPSVEMTVQYKQDSNNDR